MHKCVHILLTDNKQMKSQNLVSSKGHSNHHSDRRSSNRNNGGVSSANGGAIFVEDDVDLPSESDDEEERLDCVHDIHGDGEEADVEDGEESAGQDKSRPWQ